MASRVIIQAGVPLYDRNVSLKATVPDEVRLAVRVESAAALLMEHAEGKVIGAPASYYACVFLRRLIGV